MGKFIIKSTWTYDTQLSYYNIHKGWNHKISDATIFNKIEADILLYEIGTWDETLLAKDIKIICVT